MNNERKAKGKPLPAEWREDIARALEVLNKGGVILYPTDTIWGIGCDATNEAAVRRVFDIKHRADSKALISLVDSPIKVQGYVKEMPDVAWDLIEVASAHGRRALVISPARTRISFLPMGRRS